MRRGRPWVIVPVLSRTTVVTRPARSRAWAFFTRMPIRAPRPAPTMIAVGVARPRAQGQAMMRTDTNAVSAKGNEAPNWRQATKVITARRITAGTNTAATRSASLCTGALEPCASRTILTIWARAVSAPTRVARTRRTPSREIVAPATSSPGPLATGMDSPVSIDSSTAARPSSTTPSTGIRSPGRTMTRSPGRTSSTGTFLSSPLRTIQASLGRSARSARIAREVRPFARASRNRPRRIRAMIITALS